MKKKRRKTVQKLQFSHSLITHSKSELFFSYLFFLIGGNIILNVHKTLTIFLNWIFSQEFFFSLFSSRFRFHLSILWPDSGFPFFNNVPHLCVVNWIVRVGTIVGIVCIRTRGEVWQQTRNDFFSFFSEQKRLSKTIFSNRKINFFKNKRKEKLAISYLLKWWWFGHYGCMARLTIPISEQLFHHRKNTKR